MLVCGVWRICVLIVICMYCFVMCWGFVEGEQDLCDQLLICFVLVDLVLFVDWLFGWEFVCGFKVGDQVCQGLWIGEVEVGYEFVVDFVEYWDVVVYCWQVVLYGFYQWQVEIFYIGWEDQ